MTEQKIKELEQKIDDLERVVKGLTDTLAKWRHAGLRGLDTGDSLGDIVGTTGDLTVDGDLTIGVTGSIKWGDSAEHSIDGQDITFQNGAENLAGQLLFRSATDATRRSSLKGYFNAADPDYPIAVMDALDTDDSGTGLAAWVGVGANFDTSTAQADVNARDTGGVTRSQVFVDLDSVVITVKDSAGAQRTGLTLTDAGGITLLSEDSAGGNRASLTLADSGAITLLSEDAAGADKSKIDMNNTGQIHARVTSAGSFAVIDATNSRTMMELFPGGELLVRLADTAGSTDFTVYDSAGGVAFRASSNGSLYTKLNDTSGGAGAYAARIPVLYNGGGSLGYLRIYAS